LFVSINGERVDTTERVVELIGLSPGVEMEIVVKRQQELVTLTVTPENRNGLGKVGVSIDSKPQYPFLTSLRAGVTQTWSMTTQLIRDIGMMITGKQKVEVSGPIGIVQIVGETARYGLPNLMILAIILNIN
ncbi:MAG TPA: hypothetical protein DDW87_11875, partial [Firmicutes bacterium]|nr:hypothetical protein [Bacillota bacterium]